MSIAEAAEIGTKKVIEDHSTIGLVITTDGSFSDLPRESYAAVEGVIQELQSIGKPFLTLVNWVDPHSAAAQQVVQHLQETYGVSAVWSTALRWRIRPAHILTEVLYEFPIQQIAVALPRFVSILSANHPVQSSVYDSLRQAGSAAHTMRDLQAMAQALCENEWIDDARIANMDLGTGCARLVADVPNSVFYQIVTEQTGIQMKARLTLSLSSPGCLPPPKNTSALPVHLTAQATGYGVVMPRLEDLSLAPPEIIRQGGRYQVELLSSAASIHLMKAEIKASVLLSLALKKRPRSCSATCWRIRRRSRKKFGIPIFSANRCAELVGEELSGKLSRMPEDAREKFRKSLERIINESTGGLICILL